MSLSFLSSLSLTLSQFPWKSTAHTLRERFASDHLPLTASSLTFTTTIALVPFFTVALAVFTAFPMFSTLQAVLQKWLIESLVPDNISRQLLGYLTQFSGKASQLGAVGIGVLFITALAMILTIDHTLNAIWRVRRVRPLRQRVFIYWAAITLGPLLLGASLTLTSYAVSASKGLVGGVPGGVQFLFSLLEFGLLAAGMAALYRFVPNTYVKWAHAWSGGFFVAVGIGLAKKLLVIYLSLMPTYSVMYGAFAIAPILLVWIYVAWLIVLMVGDCCVSAQPVGGRRASCRHARLAVSACAGVAAAVGSSRPDTGQGADGEPVGQAAAGRLAPARTCAGGAGPTRLGRPA